MAEWNALPYTVKFFRDGTTNPSRNSWAPDLEDLFEMADLLEISLPELLGLIPELPPCKSEWHKYPADKPNEGETVLCQYGIARGTADLFALRVYQDGQWGLSVNGQFEPLKMKVKYWTRAFPAI